MSSFNLFFLYILILYYIKQIDSKLLCACSVIDHRMSKCGKNISDTLSCTLCATFLFLPDFDFICDLLLNRRMATWNLFVNQQEGNFLSEKPTIEKKNMLTAYLYNLYPNSHLKRTFTWFNINKKFVSLIIFVKIMVYYMSRCSCTSMFLSQ